MKRTSRAGEGTRVHPRPALVSVEKHCFDSRTALDSTFHDRGRNWVWTMPPRRFYSLSPEFYVRPTTDELDRPVAISPAIDPPKRHVEGAVNRKGQLQSEVGPRGTRASARDSRCSRRARRPGQRRRARTTHRSVGPFRKGACPARPAKHRSLQESDR